MMHSWRKAVTMFSNRMDHKPKSKNKNMLHSDLNSSLSDQSINQSIHSPLWFISYTINFISSCTRAHPHLSLFESNVWCCHGYKFNMILLSWEVAMTKYKWNKGRDWLIINTHCSLVYAGWNEISTDGVQLFCVFLRTNSCWNILWKC